MSIKQGEYLKRLRIQKGISQDALSEVLGISRQSISKWEQGNSTPDIENISKLAEFYEVSIDSIVKGEEDADIKPTQPAKSKSDDKNTPQNSADKSEAEAEKMPAIPVITEKAESEKKKRGWLFPSYPVLAVMVYCIIGVIFGANGWKIGWITILTVPLFYTGIFAAEKKKPIIFCYPVLVVIIFLLLGFLFSLWHPSWILFLTIPVFYIIAAKAGKNKSR